MVCLSDLFMEREQFEFMVDALLDVVRVHPGEDELVNQYLVVGLAKATAVVGVVRRSFSTQFGNLRPIPLVCYKLVTIAEEC